VKNEPPGPDEKEKEHDKAEKQTAEDLLALQLHCA